LINPYLPNLAVIQNIKEEILGQRSIKTFRVTFLDAAIQESFTYKPGQCVMVGILGEGESFVALSSSPTDNGYIEFTLMKLGKVTTALHRCNPGDIITVRGPYGNGFPAENWTEKNIICVGGGIGQAPLRSLIKYIIANRKRYAGRLDVFYGARSVADLCFKEELFELEKRKDVNVYLSIDVKDNAWDRLVGFVPDVLLRAKPSPDSAIAITCGPPIMIRFVVQNFLKLEFKEEQIYTTLEKKMKCGIGKCGRCNIGNLYVCKDGPVFSYDKIKNIPEAIE